MPIAQLDNAPPSEGGDCGFESRWARQKLNRQMAVFLFRNRQLFWRWRARLQQIPCLFHGQNNRSGQGNFSLSSRIFITMIQVYDISKARHEKIRFVFYFDLHHNRL